MTAIVTLDQVERRLATVRTIDEAKELRDFAEAARGLAKSAREGLTVQNHYAYIKIMAERKAGELIAKIRRVQNRKCGSLGKGICSALVQIEVPRNTAYRWQAMANVPDARVKQMHAQANAQHKELTSVAVYSAGKYEYGREEVRQHLDDPKTIKAKAFEGVYDVIVIDPPYPQDVRQHYNTMTIDEITKLSPPFAEDCHVWLWATQPHPFDARDILKAWGLRYRCTFVWHKTGGIQPTGYPQYNCEFALYARRGSPQFMDTKNFPTCFSAPRGRHSEKPQYFYDMIRRATAGRRLDMYNRRKIAGFDGWGDESPDVPAEFSGAAPEDGDAFVAEGGA